MSQQPKRRRGRPPRDYGDYLPCTGCADIKPRYRNGALVGCAKCPGPGNQHWPKALPAVAEAA